MEPATFNMLVTAIVALLVALIGAAGGGLAAWLKFRTDKRTTDHHRIAGLEARVEVLEVKVDTRDDYIEALRQHIVDGNPPPPPPYPWVR